MSSVPSNSLLFDEWRCQQNINLFEFWRLWRWKQKYWFVVGGGVGGLHFPAENLVGYMFLLSIFFSMAKQSPSGLGPPRCRDFTITRRHATLGRAPLDEWSDRRRDHYLTTYNTHKIQTSMSPARFEPTVPGSKRPSTHAIHRAGTGIGPIESNLLIKLTC